MSESLAAALAAFQADVPVIVKASRATVDTKTGGQYTYTFADLADVTRAVLPRLAEHGLSFVTVPQRTEQGDYELVGVLLHVSGERETGTLPLHGRTPQELGSSITYGRRYLIGAMTGAVTDDDDDGAHAQTAARTHQQNPPGKALLVAKHAVFEAWKDQHGDWDDLAAQVDYEAFSGGQQLTEASAEDLSLYARHLRGDSR